MDTSNATFTLTGDRRILIITLNPATAFLVNADTVSVTPATDAIVDLAGNPLPNAKAVSGAIAGDDTAPTILQGNIIGTTIQDIGDTIAIIFSEEVKAADGTFDAGEFRSIKSPSTADAFTLTNATFVLSTDKKTLTIKLDKATDDDFLVNGQTIVVAPSPGKILDLAGNSLGSNEVTGTTENGGDGAVPTITADIKGTTIQDAGDTIAITFNEEVRAEDGTFSADEFQLIESPDDTTSIAFANATFGLSTDKKTLTITLNESARGNLLRFLDDPSIEPTNNRAERALRGAVIARKVSHCSKNVGGADAFSAFTSVIRTLARNGGDHSLVNGLCGVFSGAPVPTLPSEPLLALRSANQLRNRQYPARRRSHL